ncbi:MAG: MFS transporter [Candidatus Heimdallarchaeota archaeon]|nr:MFS transporter [Candidatus Heimdallarchaeota archaeon]
MFSILGSTIVQFVLIIWIAIETQSELILGLASIAAFGPFLILGPIAGVLVDRLNRKAIIIIADATIAISTLVAIFLFYSENMNLLWFFLIITIRGIGDVFHSTTVGAMMPTMIPQKHLGRMNGINALSNGVVRIIGPAIAAGLLIVWREADLLWADVVTFIIALIPLFFISIPKVATTLKKGAKFSFFADFKDGLKTISNIKGLVPLLVMFMVVNFFFTPIGTLLPLFVTKTHGGFEAEYAIVVIFMQIGTVVGGLIMTFFKGFRKKALSSYIALLWIYTVVSTLILVPPEMTGRFWLIGSILFLVMFVLPVINVSMITAFQTIVPREKLGRTMSVLGTISSSITPIAMLLSGVIGEYVAIPWIFLGSGVLGLLISSAIWFLTKAPQLDDSIIEITEQQAIAALGKSMEITE